jgi:hypothetical protein
MLGLLPLPKVAVPFFTCASREPGGGRADPGVPTLTATVALAGSGYRAA